MQTLHWYSPEQLHAFWRWSTDLQMERCHTSLHVYSQLSVCASKSLGQNGWCCALWNPYQIGNEPQNYWQTRSGPAQDDGVLSRCMNCWRTQSLSYLSATALQHWFLNHGIQESAFDARSVAHIDIKYAASITRAWTTHSQCLLSSLEEFHVWNDEYMINRLAWRLGQPVTIMEVRCYAVSPSLRIEARDDLFGCFSWGKNFLFSPWCMDRLLH